MAKTIDDLRDDICRLFPNEKVYIVRPESLKLVYPCWLIDYKRTQALFGDNHGLYFANRYTVTHITKDSVETESVCKMLTNFKHITQDADRQIFDGLAHDYFTICYY